MTTRNFFGASGGVGTTTIAAAHALQLARVGRDVLLIDLADGALRTTLAMPWVEPSVDQLQRAAVTQNLSLVLSDVDSIEGLIPLHVWSEYHDVVIDWGRKQPERVEGERILVVTNDYGSLHRAVVHCQWDAYVLSRYIPSRALTTHDVEHALGKQMRAVVNEDSTIARAVDAGLLVSSVPRTFDNVLQQLLLAPTTGKDNL